MFNFDVIRSFHFNKTDLADMLSVMLSGISYWGVLESNADGVDPWDSYEGETFEEQIANYLAAKKTLKIRDVEDGTIYELTLKKLLTGLRMWFENGYDCYGFGAADGSLDICVFDDEAGDVVVQFAIFNEIVFG